MDNHFQRGNQQLQCGNGFQISTNLQSNLQMEQISTQEEQTNIDSYITPPARQIEQLEQKNSWFHPPKKPKKFVKRDLDSNEMQQISKKLNFFDESTSNSTQMQYNTNEKEIGYQTSDQLFNFEDYETAFSILNSGSMNQTQQNRVNQKAQNTQGFYYPQKNHINNFNNDNSNIQYNHNDINQNYSFQQNTQQQLHQHNNRNNYKYNKTTSNPESILKFR